MGVPVDEFPSLTASALYAADTDGSGNCLFHALSDQIYGDQSHAAEVRSRVIDYMREHKQSFIAFVPVHPGGGSRRNPKRKNAGAYATPLVYTPTAEERDLVFTAHLREMAKGGTYGDNMEIVAFSAAYRYNVKVWQKDNALMLSGRDVAGIPDVDSDWPVAHIAYHDWQHYSTVRNINGPHIGHPCIEAGKALNISKSPDVLKSSDTSNSPEASDQGSSSVERDQDSEDEELFRTPHKRQDRRLSRATQTLRKVIKTHSVMHEQLEESEDEDWLNDPRFKMNSSSASASERSMSAPPKPQTTVAIQGGRTQQWQPEPKKKRIARRDQVAIQKAAQKAAAKSRKQDAAHRYTGTARPSVSPLARERKPYVGTARPCISPTASEWKPYTGTARPTVSPATVERKPYIGTARPKASSVSPISKPKYTGTAHNVAIPAKNCKESSPAFDFPFRTLYI